MAAASPSCVARTAIRATVLTIAVLAASTLPLAAQSYRVRVDPRIELFSAIARVAGYPEYNQGRLESYAEALDERLAGFRDHPAVAYARWLREERGIAYDAVMSLAIHVTAPPALEERRPLDAPGVELADRWRADEARTFLAHARDLVREADLVAFFESRASFYDQAERGLRGMLREALDFEWFGRFYGGAPNVSFHVVAGLLNGGQNYGPRYQAADGSIEFYSILGAVRADSLGVPVFPADYTIPLLVHEFSHSFVNPLIDGRRETLQSAGGAIFQAVAEPMQRLAYGDWATVLSEAVIRAAVIRYRRTRSGDDEVTRHIRAEQAKGFIWIDELDGLLGEYESSRARYPNLESFAPRLVDYFRGLAPRMPDLVAAYDARRPRVVSVSPADGARDVPPETSELVVVFDRPMNTGAYGFSLVEPNGRERFPGLSDLNWDETGTTITARLKLEPGREYAYELNATFRSADDVPIEPVVVTFRTAPAADRPRP